MSLTLNTNLAPNILCQNCSCFPLLGFNFSLENKNLSDICELYSFCIFNHNNKKETIQRNNLDDIFKTKTKKKSKKINFNVICEFCKEKDIEYHCLDCQRNICKDCFENHKEHKYYYNKEYISEKELNEIRNNFEESKKNVDKNLDFISKKIVEFESQLEELKALYEKYKDINNKLISFSEYILKLYTDLVKSKQDIYYPIYFNVRNILLFNPRQINIPENDISIKAFTTLLNEKLISGFYFAITNSNFSENLCDYNKLDQIMINYDAIDINKFNKKEVEYEKIFPFKENKIIGIKNNRDNTNAKLDIFNIKNQSIETSLNLSSPEKIIYNDKYDILIFFSSKIIYILNPKDFSIKQEFSAKHKIKVEKKENNLSDSEYGSPLWSKEKGDEYKSNGDYPGKFIFVEILSKNSLAVVFDGDFGWLGEKYEKLFNKEDAEVINFDNDGYGNIYYGDYYFLIIYNKEKEIFEPKKIILLVKKTINACDVEYVSGKYCEIEEEYVYCKFFFDSMTQINKNEIIFGFKSKIVSSRNQYYFYITDQIYKNETIYYILNMQKEEKIEKIGSTKKKSLLYKNKNDEKCYFFYDKSEKYPRGFDEIFSNKKSELKTVKYNKKIDVNSISVQKNTILGWNESYIYFGKIFGQNLEIIDIIRIEEKSLIKFVSFKEKYILHKKIANLIRRDVNENVESSEENKNDQLPKEDSESSEN